MSHAERYLIADAYRRLPDRWREVLWYSEVEGHSPTAIAPMLGLSANGVSALTYRAREGRRQAYLQAHLAAAATARCRAATDRLGAWARSGLSQRERAQVEAHLDGCARCRSLAAGLTELNSALPAVVAMAVLGAAGLGYLATIKATSGAATAALGAHAGVATVKTAFPQLIGAAAAGVAVAGVAVLGFSAGGPSPAPVATSEPAVTRSPTPAPAVSPAPTTSAPVPLPKPSPAAPNLPRSTVGPTTAPPAKPSLAAPNPPPASTTPPTTPADLTLSTVVSPGPRGDLMLGVKVGNSGATARLATVEVTVSAGITIESYRGPCVPVGGKLRCTILLIPQSWLTFRVRLDAPPATEGTAVVTLTAGDRTLVTRSALAFPG